MMISRRPQGHAIGRAVLFLVAICFIVSSHSGLQNATGAEKFTPSDFKQLKGRWQRPDGEYILELKQMESDGTVKAAYFNPRPINVSRAELKRRGDTLTVYVELRDVNYPGSRYNLQYDAKLDRLTGTYFQAVHGETYTVEFSRVK